MPMNTPAESVGRHRVRGSCAILDTFPALIATPRAGRISTSPRRKSQWRRRRQGSHEAHETILAVDGLGLLVVGPGQRGHRRASLAPFLGDVAGGWSGVRSRVAGGRLYFRPLALAVSELRHPRPPVGRYFPSLKYTQPVPDRPELPYCTPPPQKRGGEMSPSSPWSLQRPRSGCWCGSSGSTCYSPLYSAIRAMILILVCIEFICVVILMRSDNGTRQ